MRCTVEDSRTRTTAGSRSKTGRRFPMKIVVAGGTGPIGYKIVEKLRESSHHAVPASPESGVTTLTGEELAGALDGAAVAVDVTCAPSIEDAAVLGFLQTSTRNLHSFEDWLNQTMIR
jgi:hypothetical protein